MLNWRSKPALEELRAALTGWTLEVPARAHRFHDLRAELDQEVAAALGRWWPMGTGRDEISALRQRVERLARLAPPLTTLIRRAEEVEKEALDLRSTVERSPDRELAQRLATRCVGWQSRLRRLGANAGREAELELDQAALDSAEDEVRNHAQALRLLEEARQLLARLGNKVETATLQADFPLLRQRLLEEGASPTWSGDMERALAPAKAVVELPRKKPPQTLQQVPQMLFEIRRWARALEDGEEKAFDLQERYKVAEAEWEEWPESRIQALLAEASGLLDELRRTAVGRRKGILARLGTRRDQLAGACGPDPELNRELADLGNTDSGEPETYDEWIERQDEVHRRILAAAGIRLMDLQERILRKHRELLERVEVLENEPLSDEARSDAGRLRLELEDLLDAREHESVEDVFDRLGACDRIARGLDALAAKARSGREKLHGICRDLLARNQALLEEAVRSGVEISDPGPRIESLEAIVPGASLDALLLQAEALGHELSALEKEFVARCAAWIAGRLALLRGRAALLRRAGRAAGELPEPLPEGLELPRAAAAVVAARELGEDLERQLEEVGGGLEARCGGLLERLRALPLKSLRPEIRREAGDLSRWLEERAWETAPDLDERVRSLLERTARCDSFLAKLSEEDRDARERAEALRRRLRDFNDTDLDRFCPEGLVQRVSALVAAIPAAPPSWVELAGQIGAAEELIGRLEAHARRVLAARLERAVPDLENQALTTRDPGYARRLRALLEEVAARDGREPVPPEVAAQVLMLASQRPWEGAA